MNESKHGYVNFCALIVCVFTSIKTNIPESKGFGCVGIFSEVSRFFSGHLLTHFFKIKILFTL